MKFRMLCALTAVTGCLFAAQNSSQDTPEAMMQDQQDTTDIFAIPLDNSVIEEKAEEAALLANQKQDTEKKTKPSPSLDD